MCKLHVIMPVKDSMDTARDAIRAVMHTEGVDFTVYNDFSSDEATAELTALAAEYGFRLVNWADATRHPSPNYRLTLQDAQRRALSENAHLVVVESDVTVKPDTVGQLAAQAEKGIGLVAAVTEDADGMVNFPYLYARKLKGGTVSTTKRLSFCCTLLSNEFLKAFPFEGLNPDKQWYDVFISHQSVKMGFRNLLMLDNRVLHRPHSSRPWKLLKYTNPLKYYWLKIVNKRDRI